jgi:hypothetical protein
MQGIVYGRESERLGVHARAVTPFRTSATAESTHSLRSLSAVVRLTGVAGAEMKAV